MDLSNQIKSYFISNVVVVVVATAVLAYEIVVISIDVDIDVASVDTIVEGSVLNYLLQIILAIFLPALMKFYYFNFS